jgi:release factor glutamine methyltransferase
MLRWEPQNALDGGRTGIELIQPMLADVPSVLLPGGLLLVEIEASTGASVLSLMRTCFPAAQVQLHTDLAGKDRLVSAQT